MPSLGLHNVSHCLRLPVPTKPHYPIFPYILSTYFCLRTHIFFKYKVNTTTKYIILYIDFWEFRFCRCTENILPLLIIIAYLSRKFEWYGSAVQKYYKIQIIMIGTYDIEQITFIALYYVLYIIYYYFYMYMVN